jgi:hypothetical protein
MIGVLYVEITPWTRDLLEKLIVAQLNSKFSAFYGTRCFIIMFTGILSQNIRPKARPPAAYRNMLIF